MEETKEKQTQKKEKSIKVVSYKKTKKEEALEKNVAEVREGISEYITEYFNLILLAMKLGGSLHNENKANMNRVLHMLEEKQIELSELEERLVKQDVARMQNIKQKETRKVIPIGIVNQGSF